MESADKVEEGDGLQHRKPTLQIALPPSPRPRASPPPATTAALAVDMLTRRLTQAAAANDASLVQALISEGADPCARLEDGSTPLAAAAAALAPAAARILLLAAVRARQAAIYASMRAAISKAMATGATPEMPAMPPHPLELKDEKGRAALHRIYDRAIATAPQKLAIRSGSRPNPARDVMRVDAARAARRATLSAFFPTEEDMRDASGAREALETRGPGGMTIAMMTAAAGDAETLFLLLENGADGGRGDDAGWTPAHHAAQRGHAAAIAVLSAEGCSLSTDAKDGVSPLLLACAGGHVAAASELLQSLPTSEAVAADSRGVTPLAAAARNGHLQLVTSLLFKMGDLASVSVDRDDETGRTALAHAAANGHA
ncbi:ankyrin repeat-containing domain protein, partial [Pavlovales sp. CCMP2436]